MSVLQQFTNRSGPPVPPPPPAATPAAASLRQQLIKQVGAPTWPALPWLSQWQAFIQEVLVGSALRGFEELYVFHYDRAMAPFLDEQTEVAEGPRPSEHAGELLYTQLGASYQGARQDSTLETLEQAYVLEDRFAIPAFIKRNRLLELLLVAREPLTSAFGEAAVKKLTLVEDDEGFVTLFCFVLVPDGLDEARWALNSFDESWWLAHSHEAGGKLNFDFELI